MELNPEVAALAVRLAEIGARGSVAGIRTRIAASKASKRDQETIEVLDEIVDELINDRSEILGIAQAFEDELVAQRIFDENVNFITTELAPKLEQLLQLSGNAPANLDEVRKAVDLLVSKELVTILQLFGFNFRDAIGRPLTELIARLIAIQRPVRPQDPEVIQRLGLENQIMLAKLALDPDAYARFTALLGPQTG